jgi:cation diffusion facilitator CzcD-associated flavoprotein CzcO
MTKSALDRADADGFRIAVVGSGPSGFYVTEALLRAGVPLSVDMFEQAQAGYGGLRQNRNDAGVSFHRRRRGRTPCRHRRVAGKL